MPLRWRGHAGAQAHLPVTVSLLTEAGKGIWQGILQTQAGASLVCSQVNMSRGQSLRSVSVLSSSWKHNLTEHASRNGACAESMLVHDPIVLITLSNCRAQGPQTIMLLCQQLLL